MEDLFEYFSSSSDRKDAPECQSYTLRLGNESYPFMKFVVQEYLLDAEYFFSVDTHDEHVDVGENDPDHEGWQQM